jgi:hypothetical protein
MHRGSETPVPDCYKASGFVVLTCDPLAEAVSSGEKKFNPPPAAGISRKI